MTNYQTKFFSLPRLLAIWVAWQMTAGVEVIAQNFFLGVQINTSNAIPVNSALTYTIGVTNLSAFDANAVFVTNVLPASVQILGQTTSQGTVSTNGSSLVFSIGLIPIGFSAAMTVIAQPTIAGFFTNAVSVFSPQLTNFITVNAAVQATNPVVRGDLEVSIRGPAQTLFPGDWAVYGITVSNLGPNTVTNITLTNSFPSGTKFLAVFPSQNVTLASNMVTFPLASFLTNHGVRNLSLRVQLPTNAGPALFSISAGATGTQDPNTANNSASTNLMISDYFSAALLAVTNSAQYTNRQTGLIEQKILVTNNSTSAVDSVRVIISGLTNVPVAGHTNYLFNATGTNNGNPFVVYAAALDVNQSVELRLQFYVRNLAVFPFNNAQLHAFGVSRPNLTPPAGASTSTNLNFTRVFPLSSGDMFLEFKSTPGKVYTIVYSDDMSFSNALMAVPPIVAPANYSQWIDYGPPATVSKPGSGMRIYRVFLNP